MISNHKELIEKEEIKTMKKYPDKDSIKMVEGIAVVRL